MTVPDTYAESHINDTMTSPGLAADQAAQQKMDKYSKLLSTHIFCPVAVETAGTWEWPGGGLFHHSERQRVERAPNGADKVVVRRTDV